MVNHSQFIYMNRAQTDWHIDREDEVNYRQAIEQTEPNIIRVGKGLLAVHGPLCQEISYLEVLNIICPPHEPTSVGPRALSLQEVELGPLYTRSQGHFEAKFLLPIG